MKRIRVLFLFLISTSFVFKTYSQLQVTFSGDTTKIWDKNTYWYCGARFTMEASRSNDSIYVTELDTMELTTCMCYFTLCANVVGLPAGDYTACIKRRLKISSPTHSVDTTMSIGTIAFTINAGTAANLSVTSYQSSCSQTPEAVEQTTEAPSSYYLLANYPNPFNPNTLIHFAIPKPGQVKISVYDLHGSLVRTLLDKYTVAGGYNISFEGSGLSSGIYFVRLNSGQKTLVGKMVLIR